MRRQRRMTRERATI
ncbi:MULTISPECIES: hypothetical protein [unclassified Caulobacter]|nr:MULTISPECIES: hypothetical protein [unclassified Caulobacter]